jgi:hypothetical protein
VALPEVADKIEEYKRKDPRLYSWEIRDKLIQDGVCSSHNAPSTSSVSRLLKGKQDGGRDDDEQLEKTYDEGKIRPGKNLRYIDEINLFINHLFFPLEARWPD